MKKRKMVSLLGVLTLSATMILSACSSSGEKDSKETSKESDNKLEDKVVIYSPHGKDILGQFEKMFEEKYGIDVEWLDMGSQEVLDRIRSEKNNPQADVWWGGSIH
ncbi:hypothetical protein [Heyndrickxia oleronia]|jgi:iron(III) transport system substrate-binding protein|uniref:hypothetical protein n=1 Tax=Heyndrickxia oleronia TaxID=38875 RepID=UPI00242C5C02|nr:hypothetical protein [Heyndrickxia oleronia]MCI1589904.1 hypothetical protein [Heyndrickxia oleronia]MCI1611615.1 hypothetical protein [Heyndrickxia oleronia]MCI1743530.1 hypothetical protein [Heyndrickxia oleronia]MCI1760137.1 hypothetical protein [Heyndrickxia oleronia]